MRIPGGHWRAALAGAWCLGGVLGVPILDSARAGSVEAHPDAARDGSHGLRVAVDGEGCQGENHATVPGTVSGSETIQACETVSAGSATVTTNSDLDLLAGYRISFGAGFTVQAGGELSADIDTGRVRGGFVRDDSPVNEPHYAARFYLRRDNLMLGTEERLKLLEGEDRQGRRWFALMLKFDGDSGEYRLFLEARANGGPQSTEGPGEIVLGMGWGAVEVEWRAARPGESDGYLSVELDGVAGPGLSALDNVDGRIDSVRWGLLQGEPTSGGHLDLDEFVSRRAGRIGPLP